jgi:hypothetical protein
MRDVEFVNRNMLVDGPDVQHNRTNQTNYCRPLAVAPS